MQVTLHAHVAIKDSGSKPFLVDIPLGVSVRCHVPHLKGDFSTIVYYQNNKINFKLTLFNSCTEKLHNKNTVPNVKTYQNLTHH
jgi:hypothetical protein